MQDIQNNKDNRSIEIKEVGIKNIVLPLYISDKAKKRQLVVVSQQYDNFIVRAI